MEKEREIQLFTPTFEVEECLAEIRECLEKGWTGLGFKTVQFEEAWKKYTGLENAYYLNSATAGLNLAVEILKEEYNWADGDEVITTPLTFISTNHAIPLAGMKAVFADIDDTNCLSPASVEERITDKTRAVIFVGIGGNTGHYKEIVEICEKHDLKLILDAVAIAHFYVSYFKGGENPLSDVSLIQHTAAMAIGMVLSEIPFDLAFFRDGISWAHQSVMVTLLLGFLALEAMK